MSNDTKIVHTGIGLPTMLLILFITLKLCNVIDWSWWIVILLPFAIQIVLIIILVLVIAFIVLIASVKDR